MYRKMINPHFSMRVALGVRIMSSLWNRIDSFDGSMTAFCKFMTLYEFLLQEDVYTEIKLMGLTYAIFES